MTDYDYLAEELSELTSGGGFSLEQEIGKAGAAVFRAAYDALAEQGTPEDPDDKFDDEIAATAATAVVRAWPHLVGMPLQMMQGLPLQQEEEDPNTMELADGTEVIRLRQGPKVFVSRNGDDFRIEIVGDTVKGKAANVVATVTLY